MAPMLSIIVPAYNVQEYLRPCLDSFVQSAAALGDEIMLVDDGATDGTPVICDEYAAQYPCVQVVHQANGGLSAARNAGMDKAQGTYLQFVDSDDWLEPGALETIHENLAQQPDLLLINVNRYLNGKQVSRSNYSKQMLAGGFEAYLDGYIRTYAVNGQAQCLIIRREVVQQAELRFHEGILHEDMEWTPLALCAAHSAEILEEPVYAYRLAREGSITAGLNEAALAKRQHSCMEAARVLAGASTQEEAPRKACLERSAGLVFSQALQYAAGQSDEVLKQLAKDTKQDVLLHMASKKMPRKISMCTGLLGLAKGTKVYLERWGKQ